MWKSEFYGDNEEDGHMYADDNNQPPTVAETYAGAIGSGVTRPAPRGTGRADLIASAGMSPYRTGAALMRLVSEWQGGATPAPLADAPTVKALAKQAAVARVNSGITASEEEYGGMKVSAKRDRRAAAPVLKHEMEFADAEARRLAAQSADWHLHENKLRFQRLKTLPTIRAGLLHWVNAKGWDNAEQLVADTLRSFLSPACPKCQGRKRKVIQSRAIGQECKACRGTGEADVQHGGRGRVLLAYLRQCTGQAAADMGEGVRKLRHALKQDVDRFNQRQRDRIDELRRADAEAEADAKQDTAAVATHFQQAMGAQRRR